MKILILSEAYNDKYFAIIRDIIDREKAENQNLNGKIIDICSHLKHFINLNSENRLGTLINPTYRDYKKFVAETFQQLKVDFEKLEFNDFVKSPDHDEIIDSILEDSATVSFATISQRSKHFENYSRFKRNKFKKLVRKLYSSYILILEKEKYDKVYIPSGKNSWGMALTRAVESTSPECEIYYYDSFGSEKNYFCEKYKPTDLDSLQTAISKIPPLTQEQQSIAQAWFREQGTSKAQNFFLSTETFEGQVQGENPLIAFFTSSEDEFIGLPRWNSSIYHSQYEGFQEVIQQILEKSEKIPKIVIRFHPHSKYKSILENLKTARFVKRFSNLGCEVILPHENVSAISLIKNAEKVFVWNSTVGIESSFNGRTTYNLADAIYSKLKVTTFVKRKSDIWSLPDTEIKPHNSVVYGYFMATTSYSLETWAFYTGQRYPTNLHYLLFANHHGVRSRIRVSLNLLLFKGLWLILHFRSILKN